MAIIAFGFKHGTPAELDLLFDVRFLRNPNYVPELQPLTGNDPAVGAYIETDPATQPFLERLFALIDFLLPRYFAQERSQVTIGIGCTGGLHRSVYIAGRLQAHIRSNDGFPVSVTARDIAS